MTVKKGMTLRHSLLPITNNQAVDFSKVGALAPYFFDTASAITPVILF